MLTDELINNISERYGECGKGWYITEETGGTRYLYVMTNGRCSLPILLHDAVMRHLGLLPPVQQTPKEPVVLSYDQQQEEVPIETMLNQIRGYCNTRRSAKERRDFLAQCHYPTSSPEELHEDDIVKLYNILKLKGYTDGKL